MIKKVFHIPLIKQSLLDGCNGKQVCSYFDQAYSRHLTKTDYHNSKKHIVKNELPKNRFVENKYKINVEF